VFHHLPADREHLFRRLGSSQEANIWTGIEIGLLAGTPQHKNGDRRQAQCEFGNEGGAAETGPIQADDHKPKPLCKVGLLYQDERFGDIGSALNVAEVTLEHGPAHVSPEWVVVDQQNSCHLL
jgi:hypothetical protein